jgi:PncC family amidohydrolase
LKPEELLFIAAQELLRLAKSKGFLLSVAESCTGGLVAKSICEVSGASDVFLGGIIAYSEGVKRKTLGVQPSTLREHTVYSIQTAQEMASGCAKMFGSQIALSTTGVAGPGGETESCKVGTIFFGYHGPNGDSTTKAEFKGNRVEIQTQAALYGLQWACDLMVKNHF